MRFSACIFVSPHDNQFQIFSSSKISFPLWRSFCGRPWLSPCNIKRAGFDFYAFYRGPFSKNLTHCSCATPYGILIRKDVCAPLNLGRRAIQLYTVVLYCIEIEWHAIQDFAAIDDFSSIWNAIEKYRVYFVCSAHPCMAYRECLYLYGAIHLNFIHHLRIYYAEAAASSEISCVEEM